MAAPTLQTSEPLTDIVNPGPMSEEDFIKWSGDHWAEWVDGEVVQMNAVALEHNNLYHFLLLLLGGFLEEIELGQLLSEPFQIRLPRQRRRRSPDICYVSIERISHLEKNQFTGGPDLIVEIVSPESQDRDRREKFLEYQAAGVSEYWLADPELRTFEAYWLNQQGKYELLGLVGNAVNSRVLPGVFFRPEWVWQLKLPKTAPLIREMVLLHKAASTPKP